MGILDGLALAFLATLALFVFVKSLINRREEAEIQRHEDYEAEKKRLREAEKKLAKPKPIVPVKKPECRHVPRPVCFPADVLMYYECEVCGKRLSTTDIEESGGVGEKCPRCGSWSTEKLHRGTTFGGWRYDGPRATKRCSKCGHDWGHL